MTYQSEGLMRIISAGIYENVCEIVKKYGKKGIVFRENRRGASEYKVFKNKDGYWEFPDEPNAYADDEEIIQIIYENLISVLDSEFTFKTMSGIPKELRCGCVKAPAKKTVARKPVRKTPAKKTVRR